MPQFLHAALVTPFFQAVGLASFQCYDLQSTVSDTCNQSSILPWVFSTKKKRKKRKSWLWKKEHKKAAKFCGNGGCLSTLECILIIEKYSLR